MKITSVFVFFLFLIGGCISTPSTERTPSSEFGYQQTFLRCEALSNFEVHGHRGAWDRPENMISAFKRGIALGADLVELDLQITKDDQVVVAHDPFMRSNCRDANGKELGSRKLYFRNMTLAEVKKYNCGTSKNPEAVATLGEVFSAMKDQVTKAGRPAGINVELKFDAHRPQYFPSRETYVSLMLDVVDRSQFEASRLLFQSFDVPILKILKQRRPDLEVSPLLGGKKEVEKAVEIARSLNANTVTPAAAFLNADLVRQIQNAGIKVIPWTVNDTLTLEKLVDWHTDGVITDHPELVTFYKKFCPQGVSASRRTMSREQRCENVMNFEVHGHRGAWDRPENTIAAFKRGIELGADVVELDLQFSKNNDVVVAHDPYLRSNCLDPQGNPLKKRKVYFHHLSLEQIKQYDCGSGERTPTLTEVFQVMESETTHEGRPAGINVEMKYDPNRPQYYPSREEYVNLLVSVVDQSGFDPSRLLFQSFDKKILRILAQKRPNFRISPLLGDPKEIPHAAEIVQKMGAKTTLSAYAYLNPAIIHSLEQAGIRVIPWVVNDATAAEKVTHWGTDGVATDHPEIFDFARSLCRD